MGDAESCISNVTRHPTAEWVMQQLLYQIDEHAGAVLG
jgi:hypothetical protein